MKKRTVEIDLDIYKEMCIQRLAEFNAMHGAGAVTKDDEELLDYACDLIADYAPSNTDPQYVVDNIYVNGEIFWSKEDLLDAKDIADSDEAIEEYVDNKGGSIIDLSSGGKVYVLNWGL